MEALTENPFDIILQAIDNLSRKVDDFRVYSINDLAEKFGCCTRTLKNKPWNLPNYGRADVEPGIWMPNTVTKWYETPEDERERRWESMSSAERLKAMGRGK